MWQRTVDCLGVAVSIASDVPSIDAQLAALFQTYADATGSPVLAYELTRSDGPVVLRNRVVIARQATELELVVVLVNHLYPEVVRLAKGVVLHAGAIGANGRALVFAGVSGAGKSTLTRALLARGYDYLSEECVSLLPDGTCRGLARPLNIEDPLIDVPPGFTTGVFEFRRNDRIDHTRLFYPPLDRVWHRTARPVALVELRHSPRAPNTLTPLSNGEALVKLWPMTFQGAIGSPLDATAAFASAPGFALHTSTPEKAQRHVLALAEQLGVVPR